MMIGSTGACLPRVAALAKPLRTSPPPVCVYVCMCAINVTMIALFLSLPFWLSLSVSFSL